MQEERRLAQLIYDYFKSNDFYLGEEDPFLNWEVGLGDQGTVNEADLKQLRGIAVDGDLDFKSFAQYLLKNSPQDAPC